MKKLIYFGMGLLLCLSAAIWYGCNDKEKEAESFGAIFGRVSVAGTAEPMRGTGVELYRLNEKGTAGALLLRTVTADDGSYSFEDVKAGEYLLRVEVPGYKRTECTVVVESGRAARADMQVIAKGEGDEGEYDEGDVYIIRAENLMVQKEDLGEGDWVTSDATCRASTVGGYTDWRLPTKEELMELYANRNLIGGFQNALYWSSSKSNNSSYPYWCVHFSNGNLDYWSGANSFRIRAVRYINPPTPEEPEESGRGYVAIPDLNLMVQTADIRGEFTWEPARVACAQSTVGGYMDWRLPTIKELSELCARKSEIGGFEPQGVYWTGTIKDSVHSDFHKLVNFSEEEDCFQGWARDDYAYRVRAVRTIRE